MPSQDESRDRSRERDAKRRRAILDAARACFLHYGFSKTSLDDIARRAGISRPLIYRKYENKERILEAVFEDVFEARYPAAREVVKEEGPTRDKLVRIYEILVVEPWELLLGDGGPKVAEEFYASCEMLVSEAAEAYQREILACTKPLLGSRELAELLFLAIEGCQADTPSVATLRRRVRLLVDRFAP